MNSNGKTIHFWVAILININIVVGSAFFVGAPNLIRTCGSFSPLVWILCGALILPLVAVFAKFSRTYPSIGGIYIYSLKHLGPFWGFVSGWGYYIGTVAANAFVLHMFCQGIQAIGTLNPILNYLHLLGTNLDFVLICFFTGLSLLNIEFLERIQIGLTLIKVIPFALILIATPWLFNISNITNSVHHLSGFGSGFPLALFAYVGFEACCAITEKIENGKTNAAKVIGISFMLIIFIYTTMQFLILGIYGEQLTNPFLEILPKLTSNNLLLNWGYCTVNFAILTSFLAGFYGMFYFNNWNLYSIGKENSILFSNQLTRLNKNQAPWVCVLLQGVFTLLFLIITDSDYLVTMSDFATTLTYFISSVSFCVAFRYFYGYLAIVTSTVLCGIFISNLLSAGIRYALPFFAILILGICANQIKKLLAFRQNNF